MIYDTFTSPLGVLVLSTDGKYLTGVYFLGQKYFESVPSDWVQDKSHPLLRTAIKQTQEYFANKRKSFDLPMQEQGTTFQKQVWEAVSQISYGRRSTYGEIASKIGRPKAVRAVGTAIGKNPLCLVVPCHRVVGSQGGLAGYAGGIDRKEKLLSLEAV